MGSEKVEPLLKNAPRFRAVQKEVKRVRGISMVYQRDRPVVSERLLDESVQGLVQAGRLISASARDEHRHPGWLRLPDNGIHQHGARRLGGATIMPSPIVDLNRAVAYGMAFGPERGLIIVEALMDHPQLAGYPYLPGVRADLLFKLNRLAEAKTEFERAAALTKNASQRALLLEKAESCRPA